MSRRTRQRVNYVLPLSSTDAGGHRLGVNGLSLDKNHSILYSGGRDGVLCAWRLHEAQTSGDTQPHEQRKYSYLQSAQAHTDWINDIVLSKNDEIVVSASSDCSVKAWRPQAATATHQIIGLHKDYVKCLASPSPNSQWVAAGGLDRKICLWDLSGAGVKSQIEVPDSNNAIKGSVYGLAANESLIASGGPECTVKVWDPRSAGIVTRFVGHTDNIRSVLISEDSEVIITASADRTVKMWSMTGGRCLCTLGMHNDSVWCLASDHPQLSVFYSGDRSGFVAKTDMRGTAELEEGLSVAICHENGGIYKVAYGDGLVWTATPSSSINSYADADTSAGFHIPETLRSNRSSLPIRSRTSLSSHTPTLSTGSKESGKLPLSCVLRLPTNAGLPYISAKIADRAACTATSNPRKQQSHAMIDPDLGSFVPLRAHPDTVIEGQNGLIKHVILNDKQRVLAMDSAGEVTMWNIIKVSRYPVPRVHICPNRKKCTRMQSFGRRDIESVAKEVNNAESVDSWCTIDTRTGTLSCILDSNYCFDAEIYADELPETKDLDLKEDQRINLGKWVLRYLFSSLIEEELRRDEEFRKGVNRQPTAARGGTRMTPPQSIKLPENNVPGSSQEALPTPKAGQGSGRAGLTPGLSIGLATPLLTTKSPVLFAKTGGQPASPQAPESSAGDRRQSGNTSLERPSLDKPNDYFSARPTPGGSNEPSGQPQQAKTPVTPLSAGAENPASSPNAENEKKDTPTSFGKRLRIPFGGRRFGRSNTHEEKKSASSDEKSDDEDSKSSAADEPKEGLYQDRLLGTIQRIREEYPQRVPGNDDSTATTLINPSPITETPTLELPALVTIVIQEDRADTGGATDVFEGTLEELGSQADLLEKVAPQWLADFLLRNRLPPKEMKKVAFTLEPWKNTLPHVTSSDGTERLTANKVLRARKVVAYVAERLVTPPAEPDPDALRPEEYLELYCENQLIPPTMTLAAIRSQIWRGGAGDVLLVYKSNGRKAIPGAKPENETTSETAVSASTRSDAG